MSDPDPRPILGVSNARKVGVAVVVIALMAAVYLVLSRSGALDVIADGEAVRRIIADLGPLGPLLIIGLLAVAIIFNPIPSAPIALAAGAAYGHLWGTVYVVIGAELGALAAFGIARLVGYQVLRRWLGGRLSFGLLGSQNTLMALVFASRLMPFFSFDLISYAAGLTPLKAWRFAVATFVGIIPMSFLLAHFGGEIADADGRRFEWIIVALGVMTLIPIAVSLIPKRRGAARGHPRDQASPQSLDSDPRDQS